MSTYVAPAGVMCPVSSERRDACILRAGHDGRHSWASGMIGCDKAPEGWTCTRNHGHPGPCAAVAAVCGAAWDFYVTDYTLTTYHVTCTLPRGHDLDHRGEIGWPS